MQILILSSRVPYPLHDGGNLAVYNLMEGLLAQSQIQLDMLCMNTSRHWVDLSTLPKLFQQLNEFKTVAIDNAIKPLPALISYLKGTSYNLNRFISKNYEETLNKMLNSKNYDFVILEGLFTSPYLSTIRKYSAAKICYRQHNVEFQIWERLANNTKNIIKKIYLQQLASALKKYEVKHLNDYDLIAAISPIDANIYQMLGCKIPIIDVPYSIKSNQEPNLQSNFEAPLKFYHIGAMDWQPNIEALEWFIKNIWPQIILEKPAATLYLAGRKMPNNFTNGLWKNVFVLGEVPDAKIFESDKHILVVPLLSGGGLRIKILEAMAAGKAVISTTIGLQGIHLATNHKNVIIADTTKDFANACINLIGKPKKAQQIGNNAKNLIQNHYNQDIVINTLLQHFRSLL